MKTSKQNFGFTQKVLVLALLAVIGPVHADDDEVAKLIKPDTTEIGIGVALASGNSWDKALFGQYNGLRTHDSVLLLDAEMIRRDEASGTWTTFNVRDLGLSTRELSYAREQQGAWSYSLGYGELVSSNPRTLWSSVQGIGSDAPVVTGVGGAFSTRDLELKRKSFTLGASYWYTPNLMVEATLRSESKDGARLSGIGGFCSNVISGYRCGSTVAALLLVPEPVDSSTQQLDIKFSYLSDKVNLHAGYYGSFYANNMGSLNPTISGNLRNADGSVFSTGAGAGAALAGYLSQPFALPPDNQAHQLYLDGNAKLLDWLKGNFNVSYTHATQNQSFADAGLVAAAGLRSNLGGDLTSLRAQAGITGRPLPKVTVRANIRYEEIDDSTPIDYYNDGGLTTNWAHSSEKVRGLSEISYMFRPDLRLTLGVDYDYVLRQRPVDTAGIPATSLTAIREWTEGAGYRAEVRRTMSDTFNATVAFKHEWREGERWMSLELPGFPRQRWVDSYTETGTFPMNMMDRTRDTIRFSGDWTPMDKVSVQFNVDDGKDDYTGLTEKGLQNTGIRAYGVDASWEITPRWKLNGYLTQSRQSMRVDHSVGYMADLATRSASAGLGLVGNVQEGFDLGASVSYINDKSRYALASGNADDAGVLPDVSYRATVLRVYGLYALNATADVRVDLAHQKARFNEWTWGYGGVPFSFADDSVIAMAPKQSVTYLGAKYVYRFQ